MLQYSLTVPNREDGRLISRDRNDDVMRRMKVYKDWILQTVLRTDKETPLVVLPIMDVKVNYRDSDSEYGVH